MSIKNLSDQRRFPRLGKVRIGVKKENAKGVEYPAKIDFFLFDAADEALNQMAAKLYGEKPKQLIVTFLTDDASQIFPQNYDSYRKGVGLVCRGDGEKAMVVNAEGGFTEIPCPCQKLENKECRRHGRFQFVLPDFPVLGIWQIDTGSKGSIVNINSGLELAQVAFGRIQRLPFRLSLEPAESQVDGKKVVVYLLNLKPIGDTTKSKLLSNILENGSAAETKILPGSPAIEDLGEEPEDLTKEWEKKE